MQAMNVSPHGQQPSAISINMAPEAPEDPAAAAQNLTDMQDLWNEWRSFKQRKLKGDLVRCEFACETAQSHEHAWLHARQDTCRTCEWQGGDGL
jgi:hypothetical protein